jgi:heme-degrading monooxygenase HmoA
MRTVTTHRPADPEAFVAAVREVLQLLASAPGFVAGELGRSPDDPGAFLLTLRWDTAGSLRRGLGSTAAKMALGPLMASADGPPVSTYEVLLDATPGHVEELASDRAAEPGPGLLP